MALCSLCTSNDGSMTQYQAHTSRHMQRMAFFTKPEILGLILTAAFPIFQIFGGNMLGT